MNKLHGTHVTHRAILLWARAAGIGRNLRDAARLSPSVRAHISKLGKAKAIPLKPGYKKMSPNLAYVMGVVMGDGYLGKYDVRLDTVDLEFGKAFRIALIRLFGRTPTLARKGKRTMVSPINGKKYVCQPFFNITLVSKAAVDFLSSIQPETWVWALPIECKLAWLRGIWDAEGFISRECRGSSKSWRLGFTNTKEWIARLFAEVLEDATGIHSVPRHYQNRGVSVWDVGIFTLADVVKFGDIVAPTILRKVREFKRAKLHYASRYPIFSLQTP